MLLLGRLLAISAEGALVELYGIIVLGLCNDTAVRTATFPCAVAIVLRGLLRCLFRRWGLLGGGLLPQLLKLILAVDVGGDTKL